MPPTIVRFVVRFLGPALLCTALCGTFGAQSMDADLTAHEWGTFTSIAGRDGRTLDWLPLNGPVALPSFVVHARTAPKGWLRGKVRMETPVLYFYSPRETTVSVKVQFSRGVMTEWYPQASRVEPNPANPLTGEAIYKLPKQGSIAWDSVTISPNLTPAFPHDPQPDTQRAPAPANLDQGNQYYAARETSAAPLIVKTAAGEQQEKFLFYRGVAAFSIPVSATVSPQGSVHLANLDQDEIPSVLLFERRGDKVGYRLGGALAGELTLDPPELTSTIESLSRDLADILTGQGLYPDEARAMIETWRDSWFEEGSRLFYIVPERFVNTVLPLKINPVPSQTMRVFVGRIELVTPATTQAVEKILAAHDIAGLRKYQRFLEPILAAMKAENPAGAAQIEKNLELTYETPVSARPQK
jgi:hypothetical protein